MGPQILDHLDQCQALPGAERLHIRWKGFASNLSNSLESLVLQTNPSTADLWLVGHHGVTFRAHRLILASASEVIKNVLLEPAFASFAAEDPVIIFEDVESQTLEDLLSFLYRGQVNLSPSRLAALVSLGQAIALKGMGDLEALGVPPTADPAPTSFTGLSLLASAALDDDMLQLGSCKSLRLCPDDPVNDENDPLNGPRRSPINLSMRGTGEPVKMPLYPMLNIPDPANFKWRRCNPAVLLEAAADNCGMIMKENRGDETPPLAIDMSSSEAVMTELPATPSPSPSSLSGTTYFVETSTTAASSAGSAGLAPMAVSFPEDPDPAKASLICSSEGKKWKSRQPKLCVHCDRYFSNQFNLKQHILNMHTVGGDVRCDKCNKTVKNKWYLRRHQVTHHNAPLKK